MYVDLIIKRLIDKFKIMHMSFDSFVFITELTPVIISFNVYWYAVRICVVISYGDKGWRDVGGIGVASATYLARWHIGGSRYWWLIFGLSTSA